MSLSIAPLGSSAISAWVRASNVVTLTLATALPSTLILPLTVNVTGSTPTNGNAADGSFPVQSIGGGGTMVTYLQVAPNDSGSAGSATILVAFQDIPDSAFGGNQWPEQWAVQALSRNAKFAALRYRRFFMGYFTSFNVVPTPVGDDGYQYSLTECIWRAQQVSSRQPNPSDFTPGQLTRPPLNDSDLGSGRLVGAPYTLYVERTTGMLICQQYFSDTGVANQGTVRVYCIAQRLSVNQ